MKRFLLSCVAAVAMLLAVNQPVWADHFEYLAQDPAAQIDDDLVPGKENWVFRYWGLHNQYNLLWWADATLEPDVTTSMNNWTAAVPELAGRVVTHARQLIIRLSAAEPGYGFLLEVRRSMKRLLAEHSGMAVATGPP